MIRINTLILTTMFFLTLAGTAQAQVARTGKIVGLAVIVEYQDQRTVHTRQQVDELFNRAGGMRGGDVPISIYDYYKHFSNGHLELNHVVAPVITLPFTRAQSNGDFGGVRGLWKEAKKIFDTMNFDLSGVTLDSKGNPVLITMLVSGGFANTAGTGLSRTRMSTDRNSIPVISFGVLAHEIGHALLRWGHPGVSADGRCLMESGWKPNPYYRHTAGWIEPVDITNAPPGTVLTLDGNSHQALIFRRNEREAFYIDAQNTGDRPQGIRGRDERGLLIWHIDMNAGRSGVGGGGFSRVELVHADGRNDTIGDADLFRSGAGTHFSGTSTPVARWHDGTLSNINITGISETGALMTFRIGDIPPTPINRLLWQIWPYISGSGDVVINLDQNIMLSAAINIPRPAAPGAKITIRSANPSRPVTLTRGTSGSLITVSDGAALILENIIIDGGGSNFIDTSYFDGNDSDNLYGEDIESAGAANADDPEDEVSDGGGTLVRVNGGAFTMNAGVVLHNNINKTANADGGAVTVLGNGTFIMNGGTISGNSVSRNGGGVYVTGTGTFTMSGGEIINNISNANNSAGTKAVNGGGGVYKTGSGTFRMSGGRISNNTGNGGGGLEISGGNFIFENGEISGNTSTRSGGALSVSGNGTVFTMRGGKISGNSAVTNGGGLSLGSRGQFNMSGGEISANTANGDGGGVIIASNSTFTMTGGEISGNTGKDGGGIRLSGGTFTLQNGKIYGNTANLGGGGASVSGSSSVFNINGGSINGNTSVTNPGGGIAMWSSATVTMSGGEIIGNKAPNGTGVRRAGGTFNLNGGVVAGTGTALTNVVNGTYQLNRAAPSNAVVIAWNRPSGTLNYTVGTNTNLTVSAGGTATWANQGGILGISYTNGANRGWLRLW